MSLRWTMYVAPKPPKGAQKRKTAAACVKSHFAWKKCYKVSLCESCQWYSCKAFIGLTIRAKWLVGDVPLYAKIWQILPHSPIFYLFSLVATQPQHLAKKSSINTIGSSLRAFQWAQDEHRTSPLTPSQRVAQKRSVKNLNNELL